ncbi:hypothetical protein B7R78_0006970 [Ralstonia solanacearum]|uniref:hypothetical protein n=1 Tax=Ralstonia solanacearum TaxID=305 RepID=UPI0015E8D3E5|nr:hypothetical protein [Ralstonia solanacearum]MBT1536872.1 hypothetical protein [Ralstonia solanacearum]
MLFARSFFSRQLFEFQFNILPAVVREVVDNNLSTIRANMRVLFLYPRPRAIQRYQPWFIAHLSHNGVTGARFGFCQGELLAEVIGLHVRFRWLASLPSVCGAGSIAVLRLARYSVANPVTGSTPKCGADRRPRDSTANGINDFTDGPTSPTADSATKRCASGCQT